MIRIYIEKEIEMIRSQFLAKQKNPFKECVPLFGTCIIPIHGMGKARIYRALRHKIMVSKAIYIRPFYYFNGK